MAELSQTFDLCPIPDMSSQPERRAALWESLPAAAHRGAWTGGPAWVLDVGSRSLQSVGTRGRRMTPDCTAGYFEGYEMVRSVGVGVCVCVCVCVTRSPVLTERVKDGAPSHSLLSLKKEHGLKTLLC